jgi:hypothetical protein
MKFDCSTLRYLEGFISRIGIRSCIMFIPTLISRRDSIQQLSATSTFRERRLLLPQGLRFCEKVDPTVLACPLASLIPGLATSPKPADPWIQGNDPLAWDHVLRKRAFEDARDCALLQHGK